MIVNFEEVSKKVRVQSRIWYTAEDGSYKTVIYLITAGELSFRYRTHAPNMPLAPGAFIYVVE